MSRSNLRLLRRKGVECFGNVLTEGRDCLAHASRYRFVVTDSRRFRGFRQPTRQRAAPVLIQNEPLDPQVYATIRIQVTAKDLDRNLTDRRTEERPVGEEGEEK